MYEVALLLHILVLFIGQQPMVAGRIRKQGLLPLNKTFCSYYLICRNYIVCGDVLVALLL